MFGIINNDSKFCLALNHLVIRGKYFLYVIALNGKCYILNEFVSLARDKIKIEKHIRVFRFSGVFSNSAISLRIRARGKEISK